MRFSAEGRPAGTGLVLLALAVWLPCGTAAAGEGGIFGKVLDQATGEPLRKVRIVLKDTEYQTASGDDGSFRVDGVPGGNYMLYVSTVGYRLVKREIRLEEGRAQEVLLFLGQEASTVNEIVRVTAPLFEEVGRAAPAQVTLNSTEIKNLAGVLIDDPLRSVQTLPGVATGDDFYASYSVRGGSPLNNGIMVDGVLTHNLAHTIQGTNEPTGSVTLLNGDLVESMALYQGAFSPKYGDRTASFLDVVTREGSRDRVHSRIAVSGTNAAFVAEGPADSARRSSWIVSARKSYADYLVRRISKESDLNLGFSDIQAKFVHDASDHHRLDAALLWGRATISRDPAGRGPNTLIRGTSSVGVGNLHWSWIPGPRLMLETRLYLIGEAYSNRNRDSEMLAEGDYTELAVRSDLSVQVAPRHRLESGILARLIDNRMLDRRYDFALQQFYEYDWLRGRHRQTAAYFQDRWDLVPGSLTAVIGMRTEDSALTGQAVVDPRASLEWRLGEHDRIDAGWGVLSQLPEAQFVLGRNGNPALHAEVSRHFVVGYERHLGAKSRVRMDFYAKEEANLFRSRDDLFRLINGQVTPPDPDFRYDNGLRGSSRGVEFLLQRRTANRLAGWLSYAYARTRRHDLVTGEVYPGEFDQTHTINAYGSYRFSESWNLSLKARFGSNFAYPGYFEKEGTDYYLSEQRNRELLPYYGRIDFRLNRAFFFSSSKLSLYVEVVNILNRENIRFAEIYSVNPKTKRIRFGSDKLFPILPTAGFVLEF